MAEPTLPEQVTKLYDLIAGYHATHLLEIGRELGVWEAITAKPGITSDALAKAIASDPFYTEVLVRTAFAIELVEREGDGWRMWYAGGSGWRGSGLLRRRHPAAWLDCMRCLVRCAAASVLPANPTVEWVPPGLTLPDGPTPTRTAVCATWHCNKRVRRDKDPYA
jgi:hypothetical protein